MGAFAKVRFQLPLSGSPTAPPSSPPPPTLSRLSTPSLGITLRRSVKYKSRTRILSTPSLGITSNHHELLRRSSNDPFNSLSRDHIHFANPSGSIAPLLFQLPLSGSRAFVSRPCRSFSLVLHNFQLPLSGSPNSCMTQRTLPLNPFNSLSRDHQKLKTLGSRSFHYLSTPSLGITL